MEAETVETDAGKVKEEINDAEGSIGETEGDVSEEHRAIVEQLKKTMVEGRAGNDIMFKKVDKKVLKVQIDKVNEATWYLKSKSIIETSNMRKLGKEERIGLKKAEHRKKNEPR